MPAHDHTDHYSAKADFDHVYDQPDPRAYFDALGAHEYEIPAHGTPVAERLLDEMGGREGRTVLDVCCGYGVNAALLNHDVELADVYDRYAALGADLGPDEVVALDRAWYAARRRADAVEYVGLDVAGNAVGYATSVGLLDRGVVANLEGDDALPGAVAADADLVTITGGIGYVGERTLGAIVEAAGDDPPWIAAHTLRWIDFEPIASALEDEYGLVTEHLEGYTVPQRRFASDDERRAALAALAERGRTADVERNQDAHCAELMVVRPPEAVREAPLDKVLDDLTDPAQTSIT